MSDCFSPIDPSPTLHDGKEPISCPGKTVFIVLLGAILCCLIRYQPMPFARVSEPFDHPEWLFREADPEAETNFYRRVEKPERVAPNRTTRALELRWICARDTIGSTDAPDSLELEDVKQVG
jgi:hypothetical protein